MMLFHSSCPLWDKKTGPVPRLLLTNQGIAATRTYVCEWCEDKVHVDMDWKEGAVPEREATLA